MTVAQMNLDLAGRPSVRAILDRIREESRDEAEKGRWFEHLFMRVALQEPEFELDGIWRWAEWPEREALTGAAGKWLTLYEQPAALVRKGDWRPCQFLDPDLVRAALGLEEWKGLVPLESRYQLGPAGRRIRDAFRPVDDAGDDGYRVFWGRSKDLRTTMAALPEQTVADRKPALVSRYRQQAGHVLLAARFDTISGRLLAIFSDNQALGSMWVPIQIHAMTLEEAKALCAWCNSTLGALGFLMRRGTMLTNPSFSQAELATLRVPDFRTVSANALAKAFEQTRDLPVRPWKDAADDDMRDTLDRAAAATTGIGLATIRYWRARISREPTIANVRAEAPGREEAS